MGRRGGNTCCPGVLGPGPWEPQGAGRPKGWWGEAGRGFLTHFLTPRSPGTAHGPNASSLLASVSSSVKWMPPSLHLEAMYVSFLFMAAMITTSNVTVRKSPPWSKDGQRVYSPLPEAAPRQARAPHALETFSLPPASKATSAAVSVAPMPSPCRQTQALNSLGQVGGWASEDPA